MTAPAYDSSNVFAKILKGDLPCYKVYEDDKTLAFMDIMPRSDGHTLIIPKNPSRNILDIAPDDLAAVIATTQKIAKAARKAFAADGLSVTQYNEAAGGQEVFHLHFHVIPRQSGEQLKPPGELADKEVLERHAAKLRAALETTS